MEPQVKQEFNAPYDRSGTERERKRVDARHMDYKSPALAGFLSMLPGLGQVYVGYYKHGFMYILIYAFTIVMLSGGGFDEAGLEPLGAIFLAFFWFFNIIDAVRRARMFNRVIDGVSHAELPPDFELPGIRGSVTTGIVLIAIGFLLFLHTMFDVSLAWLQDWWPLAMVGFGAWLIYKEVSGKSRKDAGIGMLNHPVSSDASGTDTE